MKRINHYTNMVVNEKDFKVIIKSNPSYKALASDTTDPATHRIRDNKLERIGAGFMPTADQQSVPIPAAAHNELMMIYQYTNVAPANEPAVRYVAEAQGFEALLKWINETGLYIDAVMAFGFDVIPEPVTEAPATGIVMVEGGAIIEKP
jgi:hypothetical protein